MKNIKKINLAEVSDKQALSMDQFSKIIGGSVDDACSSGGCAGGVMEIQSFALKTVFVQVVSLHGEIMDSFNSPNTLCM